MSNVFQTCLKGFKLKMMVVEPKPTQPVEPNEEPVNQFSSTDRMVQKPALSFKTLVQQVEVQLKSNQGVIEVQRSSVKH